ncbi:MAG: restriction endonuclease subunit S [Fusobacteria bacterium]|nr:restriction endonuclease subunit S [Fusobacteriota bacterium]
MKSGWEVKKLGEMIEIRNGKNQQDVLSESGKYKIMGSAGNVMGYATDFICEAGTTIIGRKGNISKPIYINEPFWNVDTAFGLYPINEKNIDKRFVYYLCLGIDFKSMNRGTTIPSLVKSELQSIEIPIPPLAEQQRIVSILDNVFSELEQAKENAQRNLKNAKELFESYLQGVFENKGEEWEEKKIEEVAKIVNGYSFESKDFSSKNIIKSVKITNVGVKEFIKETDNFLPEKYKESFSDFQVKEGNIVMALTRTIIASGLKVAVVPKSYDGALLNQRVAALIPIEKIINQKYLYYFLCSENVSEYVKANVNTLMQPNLSINDLKRLMVPLPSLQEQQVIVSKLDELSAEVKKLETIYTQKLEKLEELKKAILHKAFEGEL